MKPIRQDFEQLIQRIKELHKAALDIPDEELIAALAFFRPASPLRHVPEFEDVMTYYVLQAVRAFRNAPVIDPGDSPFSYKK